MSGKIYPTVTSVSWHPGNTAPRHLRRKLTWEEALYAQTFPPTYKWPPQKTKKWKLLGNAFPPKMARVIADMIPLKGGTFIDLFCGVGGWIEGFKHKFECVLAVDVDPLAARYCKLNHPEVPVVCADILHFHRWPKADIVVGSPPCQQFSVLRFLHWDNYKGKKVDLSLIKRFYEVVAEVKPKFWFMENVRGVRKWIKDAQVVNMADFGVPQKRVRAIHSNMIIKAVKAR